MGEVLALFPKNEVSVSHTCLECKHVFDITYEKDMPKADCPKCSSGKVVPYALAPVRDSFGPCTTCECGCTLFYSLPYNTIQCSRCASIYQNDDEEEDEFYELDEEDVEALNVAYLIDSTNLQNATTD